MRNIKIRFCMFCVVVLTMVLTIGCSQEHVPMETDIMETVQGPAVISMDDNVTVTDWSYNKEISNSVFSDDNGIKFGGVDGESVMILWNDNGFDIYWAELPCADKPVLVIQEDNILELFGGKQPEDLECEAMAVYYSFSVTLNTILSNDWSYVFHYSSK